MRRLRRIVLRVFVALVVVVAATWAALALWDRSLDARLDAAHEALRQEGAPLDLGPLARVAVPPGDDALPHLKEGLERKGEHPEPLVLLDKEYPDFNDADWEEVALWLERQAPARAAFAEAARKPACSWDYREDEPPFSWIIEPLPAIQEATQLFEAEARLLLRNGAPAADVLDVASRMIALRRHMDDRFAIGWLVRFTVESEALTVARDLAARGGPGLERVRAWVGEHRAERGIRPVADVLRHERAFAQASVSPRFGGLAGQIDRILDVFGELEDLGVVSPLRERFGFLVPLLLRSPAGPALTKRVALNWLDADAKAIDACRAVEAGTPDAVRAAVSEVKRLWYDPFGPPVETAPRLAESMLARRARFSITEAGLAALAWKREHGDWPSSVAGRDPFTGEPLGYEPIDDGGVRIFARAPARFDELEWRLPAANR